MIVAGVTVEDRLVLKIAKALPHSTLASKLVTAYTLRSSVVNLTKEERRQSSARSRSSGRPSWETSSTSSPWASGVADSHEDAA